MWTKDDIVIIDFSAFEVSLLTANHVHTVESSSLISISSFYSWIYPRVLVRFFMQMFTPA